MPIAIVSHGFMAFQDTVRHYAKAFAEMGYLSYCFDFSGGCVSCGSMKLGRRYVEDVIRMDPFAEISGFLGNVLIIHGSGDNVVDISYSQKAYEAYREKRTETDGTVALRIIENAGHGFSKKEDETALEYLKSFAE